MPQSINHQFTHGEQQRSALVVRQRYWFDPGLQFEITDRRPEELDEAGANPPQPKRARE